MRSPWGWTVTGSRDDCAGAIIIAFCLSAVVSVVWLLFWAMGRNAADVDALVSPPKTCSITYDRRDAPGSIVITWDDPKPCDRVKRGLNPR